MSGSIGQWKKFHYHSTRWILMAECFQRLMYRRPWQASSRRDPHYRWQNVRSPPLITYPTQRCETFLGANCKCGSISSNYVRNQPSLNREQSMEILLLNLKTGTSYFWKYAAAGIGSSYHHCTFSFKLWRPNQHIIEPWQYFTLFFKIS